MNFFKRYYDKVILLSLFVLFVALMITVLSVHQQTREITPEQLRLPRRRPDHVCVTPEHDVYKYNSRWNELQMKWQPAGNNSDLVSPQKLAVCPYCAEKVNSARLTLIPFSAFDGKKSCPVCATKLEKPTETQMSGRVITANDSDGDGISNEDERKYGLNPEDERDAAYDMDGDGFSNRYEIAQKKRPNDATDHPPLWHRLRVVDVRTVELPIRFMGVNTNNKSEKKSWEIQYNLPRTSRRGKVRIESNFVFIGDEISVDENDNRRYVIVDVQRLPDSADKGDEQDKKDNAAAKSDGAENESSNTGKFKIKLREVLEPGSKARPEELEPITREPTYSNDLRPVLQDTGRPGSQPIVRRINAEVVIERTVQVARGRRPYRERYRIVKVDHKTKHVTIVKGGSMDDEDDKNVEKFVITPEGKVAREDWVVEGKTQENASAEQ